MEEEEDLPLIEELQIELVLPPKVPAERGEGGCNSPEAPEEGVVLIEERRVLSTSEAIIQPRRTIRAKLSLVLENFLEETNTMKIDGPPLGVIVNPDELVEGVQMEFGISPHGAS